MPCLAALLSPPQFSFNTALGQRDLGCFGTNVTGIRRNTDEPYWGLGVVSGFVTLSMSFEFSRPQFPLLRSYSDVSRKDLFSSCERDKGSPSINVTQMYSGQQ